MQPESLIYHLAKSIFELKGKVFTALPPQVSLSIGKSLGLAVYYLLKKRRIVTLKNLKAAFNFSKEKTERIAKKTYMNLGMNVVEFMMLPYLGKEEIIRRVSFSGKEYFKLALSSGRGAILFTAHFGNWEMMAARVCAEGFPLIAVNRRQKGVFAQLISDMREEFGLGLIFKGDSPKKMFSVLNDNKILGIVGDQGGGICVNFLERFTIIPTGTALFSNYAPVVVGFIFREKPEFRHQIKVLKYFKPSDPEWSPEIFEKDRRLKRKLIVRYRTQKLANLLEKVVKERPDHWFWLHKIWKDLKYR